MKKYLFTIYNDKDGTIKNEIRASGFSDKDIKNAIICILQRPDIKIEIDDNILVQVDDEKE